MSVELNERFLGAMFGVMTGDALGRNAKGRTPDELAEQEAIGREMLGGFYTEDTEMTFAVAESLLDQGTIDQDALADHLGQILNPMRGYNPGLLEVLYKLQQGVDWRDANTAVFERGSFGVGASCRAVPIGLYFHDDLDLVVAEAALSAQVTHTHPVGEGGAVAVALGTAFAARGIPPHGALQEIAELLSSAGYDELVGHLDQIDPLHDDTPSPAEVAGTLGNSLTVQACIPAAFYCTLRHPDSFEWAVSFAVQLGGDADTIAAMVGALSGAYHGMKAIPDRWVWELENEEHGRDAMRELAGRLYAGWQARSRPDA